MSPAEDARPDAERSDHDSEPVFVAVDIGASSGRVVAGRIGAHTVSAAGLEIVHRFPNGAAEVDGHLRWDLTGLFEQVLIGLAAVGRRYGAVQSIGVDTWAVDYGLLGQDGQLLAEPIAYRDSRTDTVLDRVHDQVTPAELYAINGLQFLPFTTLYQLAAEQRGALWPRARRLLLLPDLITYWLTGQQRTERTNASTTGLLDARTGEWSTDLLKRLDLPPDLLPPLIAPGETVGALRPSVAARTGLTATTPVIAVGSHDTASAVVGVPAVDRRFAYVSSGTWSLVGVEVDEPVLSEPSRAANFTNEGGVDGRIRYLRNMGGLWLLQESLRTWAEQGADPDQDELLAAAARLPAGGPRVDVDDVDLIPPGDMPRRIADACRAAGQSPPESPEATVRCILDSLATAYARTVADAERLADHPVEVVHVVGGGSQNELLCQLTADLADRPVEAGPVEATAWGNLAVQARAAGRLDGDLEAIRGVLRTSVSLRCYPPGDRR